MGKAEFDQANTRAAAILSQHTTAASEFRPPIIVSESSAWRPNDYATIAKPYLEWLQEKHGLYRAGFANDGFVTVASLKALQATLASHLYGEGEKFATRARFGCDLRG